MLESLHWRIELIFKILLFVLWEFSDLLVRLWSLKFLKFLLGLVFRSKTVGCSMFMRLNELKSPEDLMKQDEQNSSSRCFHPSNDAWSLTLFFTHPLNSWMPHHTYLHLCFCVFACPQDVFIWKTWVVFLGISTSDQHCGFSLVGNLACRGNRAFAVPWTVGQPQLEVLPQRPFSRLCIWTCVTICTPRCVLLILTQQIFKRCLENCWFYITLVNFSLCF